MAYEPDPRDLVHLDAWLEAQIQGDKNREYVRAAMLALAAEDPEYWWSQAYWNWIDNGIPQRARDVACHRLDLRDEE